MTRRRTHISGYILVETTVALTVLGIGAFVAHSALREAMQARGQAQDYTQARFLLEQKMGELAVQPRLTEGRSQGQFSGAYGRFRWEQEVRRVDVPKPAQPIKPPPPGKRVVPFTYQGGRGYLARVRVAVAWERGGMTFSESLETLLGQERLWQPRPRRAQ